MKQTLLYFMLLLLISCYDDGSANLSGQWQISWSIDNEIRIGALHLNDNHTGIICVEADSTSIIIKDEEYIAITWNEQPGKLLLTRLDNQYVLEYEILERSESSIEMLQMNQLKVNLTR